MAGAIKGITVEIGGDTTKLGKALADVNKKSKDLQAELKGVNTLLKMDPGNVTLLKQKQDLLTESIANTKEKLNTLEEAQKQVQEQFDKGEITAEQYRDFQREIVATEQKLESLNDQMKEFGSVSAQKIALAGEKVNEFGGKVEDAGKKMSVVSGGIVALGTACVGAFYELDDGYDTIITKTGATGEALDSLNESADNVFASMPVEMADVGTAIGEVNTRFGYTGTKLEDLSSKFLQFANINGVDLNNSIGMVDKILEQFNMTGEDAGGVLDLISKKAQETGIGADTLMKLIQDNGTTFKDMGIGVNEAVVLLSQFEANGVNVETALKGLKKSTVEYAKEGLSMEEGLAKTIDSIKNAKTETEALAEVEKIFGSKGANEMVKAIREGRISVEDLSASMGDYAGTVENTFNETLDPVDNVKVGFNNLKLVGSQLGDTIQTALLPIVNGLVSGLKKLNDWFSNLSPTTKTLIVVIGGLVASIGPVLIIIGKLISSVGTIMTTAPKIVTMFKGIGTAFKSLGAAMSANPLGVIIIALTALVAGLIYAYNHSEKFRDIVNNAFSKVKEVVGKVVDALVNFFTVTIPNAFNTAVAFFQSIPEKVRSAIASLVSTVRDIFTNVKNTIFSIAQNIYDKLPSGFQLVVQNVRTIIQNFVNIFKNNFEVIKTVVQTVISVIKAIFAGDFASIPGIVSKALGKIKTYVSNIFDSVVTIVVNWIAMIINYFRGWGETCVQVFKTLGTKISNWWSNFKTTFTNWVKNLISSVVNFFKELPGKIYNAIVSAISKIKSWGSSMLSTAKSAISNLVSNVVSTAKTLPSKLYSAIQSAISKVKNWGSSLISAAKSAISNMISNVVSLAKTLPGKFLEIGKDIINGIKNGITGAISGLYDSIKKGLSGLVDKAKDALGINSPSKVFAKTVGVAIPEGIAKGIDDNTDIADNAVQDMTDDLVNQANSLNGATLKRKLATTFNVGSAGIGNDNTALLNKLDGIYERLSRLQIVLDTGTLVGETIDKIDAGLADKQLLSARGV